MASRLTWILVFLAAVGKGGGTPTAVVASSKTAAALGKQGVSGTEVVSSARAAAAELEGPSATDIVSSARYAALQLKNAPEGFAAGGRGEGVIEQEDEMGNTGVVAMSALAGLALVALVAVVAVIVVNDRNQRKTQPAAEGPLYPKQEERVAEPVASKPAPAAPAQLRLPDAPTVSTHETQASPASDWCGSERTVTSMVPGPSGPKPGPKGARFQEWKLSAAGVASPTGSDADSVSSRHTTIPTLTTFIPSVTITEYSAPSPVSQ